jgi:anti-sigma-K factor RskA
MLTAREATLNAIFEPGVQMFQLTASGDPDPGIQLFWDRQRNRAVVHGFKLKAVPEGRAYQLWFIKDGAPVPSVTFKPEPTGHVRLEQIPVPADGEVSAAAVTVEPESGSAQPTTPILLVGPLKRS